MTAGRAERLYAYWVYGGLLAAITLLAVTPLLGLAGPILWAFLALPAYMIHQYEEHDADRFRLFVNDMLGPDRAGLTTRDVFLINIVGVWAVIAAALWLMRASAGWAAIVAWLLLINAVVHVAQAIALRRSNPGLVTAVVLFLPLGATILAVSTPSPGQHAVAALLILALHGAIVLRAGRAAR